MKISAKRGYTLIEAFVVLFIIAIVVAILFPIFARRGPSPNYYCMTNLKQLGLAMIQYTQDNDEKFPLYKANAATASTPPFAQPYGWADAIEPYAKSLELLQCPGEVTTKTVADGVQSGFTDYWFNANLNARPFQEITNATHTFLLGEGNDGREITTARYHLSALPQRWLAEENSPAQRHSGAGNYLFADGHVKALTPKNVIASNGFAIQRQ